HNVSFQVRAGEIVGMAGLVGAGRSEVARCIFGAERADAGTVSAAGLPLRGNSVREAMDRGIAMVPEDRQHLGLVLPLSVATNLSLAVLRTLTNLRLTSSNREPRRVEALCRAFAITAPDPSVPAQTL